MGLVTEGLSCPLPGRQPYCRGCSQLGLVLRTSHNEAAARVLHFVFAKYQFTVRAKTLQLGFDGTVEDALSPNAVSKAFLLVHSWKRYSVLCCWPSSYCSATPTSTGCVTTSEGSFSARLFPGGRASSIARKYQSRCIQFDQRFGSDLSQRTIFACLWPIWPKEVFLMVPWSATCLLCNTCIPLLARPIFCGVATKNWTMFWKEPTAYTEYEYSLVASACQSSWHFRQYESTGPSECNYVLGSMLHWFLRLATTAASKGTEDSMICSLERCGVTLNTRMLDMTLRS